MCNPFMWLVTALNAVTSNVWSIVLICAGSLLTLHGHSDVGGSLITGGFAILRGKDSTPSPTPSTKE